MGVTKTFFNLNTFIYCQVSTAKASAEDLLATETDHPTAGGTKTNLVPRGPPPPPSQGEGPGNEAGSKKALWPLKSTTSRGVIVKSASFESAVSLVIFIVIIIIISIFI